MSKKYIDVDAAEFEAGEKKMKDKRMSTNLLSVLFLVVLIGLTFWMILKDNDITAIYEAIIGLDTGWLAAAVATALFFVSAEGFMIWYILRTLKCGISLPNCIGYSFVGFFFSGITPSASGGQPMQLYYMSKDGIKISHSTVALTIVATLYKFVLVLIGVFLAIFFNSTLNRYLEGYIYLFYFGLSLNFIVVVVLVFLMINPNAFRRIARKCERGLVKTHILKPSVDRVRRITKLAKEYNMAVTAFMKNIKTIVITAFVTVLQRCSIFFITYFIYRGMGLNKESVVLITVLQASVYVAVDLLPLPGSQGISELMYQTTFGLIFIGAYLPASVLITRGISFYLPLIVGFAVTIIFHFVKGRKKIQDKVFEK